MVVAILVSPKTEFDVLQWKKDTSGRILSVLAHAGETHYNFVNIYAPTNPTERKRFFDTLIIIIIIIIYVIGHSPSGLFRTNVNK